MTRARTSAVNGNRRASTSVVVSMRFGKRSALGTCVVAVALLVGGCSNSGGKQSTPMAPCQQHYPFITDTYDGVNAGTHGLGKQAVPIAADRARLCRYAETNRFGLVGSVVLPTDATTKFEDETNRLPTVATRAEPACHQRRLASPFVVTFARGAESVNLYPTGCGFATNGTLSARATTKWVDELKSYTSFRGRA